MSPGSRRAQSGQGTVESDPLAGVRLVPSSSPSRVRLHVSLPLAERGGRRGTQGGRGAPSGWRVRSLALEARWSVSSRGPRPEIWFTLMGGAGTVPSRILP